MTDAEDFEVCWTGGIETAETKRQQRPALPRARGYLRTEIALAALRAHPWSTMREIATLSELTMQQVNGALYLLVQRGQVQQSHRQQECRQRPVRWAVR